MTTNQVASAPRKRVKTISLTVSNAPDNVEQPPEGIICLQCPNARWKLGKNDLSCFCYMHHADTFPQAEFYDCDEYRIMIQQAKDEAEKAEKEKANKLASQPAN